MINNDYLGRIEIFLIDFGGYIMIDRFHFSISACTLIQERDSKVIYLFKIVVLSRTYRFVFSKYNGNEIV